MAGKGLRVGIDLMRAQEVTGTGFMGLVELAQLADRMGVDEVHISEHLAMSRAGYERKGYFPYPLDYDGWYEPIASLSAIAMVTQRVRLATNILIAPLRPALLLAKQIATLDVISRGRVEAGFGVGWQKEEFEASNIAFEGRYGLLEEQVQACRALWSGGGARFAGERISFEDLTSLPLPAQGARLPISLGLPPTDRNLERIARLADGWYPVPMPAEELAGNIVRLRAACMAAGRDPGSVSVRAPMTLHPPGSASMDEVFAEAPGLIATGADILIARPLSACRSVADWEEFLRRLVALKG